MTDIYIKREDAENLFCWKQQAFQDAIHNLPAAEVVPVEDIQPILALLDDMNATGRIEYDVYSELHDTVGGLFCVKEKEYIEREALERVIHTGMNISGVMQAIIDAPAADVRPVVRGKWIYDCERTAHDGWTYKQYHCDKCGGEVIGGPYDYCYFCGADMREP
mgnify:CR=1 FL=1